ncbi:hemagglutinin repeat-containing protein [Ralstonia solanacearum species complex bacterium KE056]|uniref:hemagglutinin repeat-containing protein n=1 Tax=Ralstonia solanacearum species complex bacterium KE056 TaxID=3119585 RepID=UPI002FC38767
MTANASASRGKGEGSDVSWTNTHALADNTLTLESGGNTNLLGAVANCKQGVAGIPDWHGHVLLAPPEEGPRRHRQQHGLQPARRHQRHPAHAHRLQGQHRTRRQRDPGRHLGRR